VTGKRKHFARPFRVASDYCLACSTGLSAQRLRVPPGHRLVRTHHLADDDKEVGGKLDEIKAYVPTKGIPPEALVKMAKFALVKDFFEDIEMSYQDIIAGTVGKENIYGTVVGRIKSGPFTYCRVSTDDARGVIRVYLGEGEVTDDPLQTFGGYGVVNIPNFQGLLKHICENGYEHHVAVNRSQVAAAVNEALSKYLGWDVYYHKGNGV
jgi:L-fucose isomerase-like protein